jgi:ATP-binding cassette subfamily B protein
MSSDTSARTPTTSAEEARVDAPRPRRGFGRRRPPEGPRATFRQLLPYLFEHKRVMTVIIVLSVLGAAASLGQPLLVQRVIAVVEQGDPLGRLVWALVALVVIAGLLSGFQHYLLQRTGEGVVLSSRRRLVGRMLRLPISEFDTRRTGDLVSRVGSDTTLLRAVLTQGLVEAIGGSLTFVGALVGMFLIDPVLLGLTVLVVAVSVVVVVLLSGRIRVASRQAQEKVGDLTAAVERAISSVRTIRASGATEREIAAVELDAVGAYQRGLQVARISALVVLGVGGFRVASGDITIASLVSFVLFLFLMIMPLGQALGAVLSVNQALGALGRIQEILDLPSEDHDDLRTAGGLATTHRVDTADAVTFDDVHFRYPAAPDAAPGAGDAASAAVVGGAPVDDDLTVLRGVSFSVPAGRRTALVGPSGAGKSTMLALIERFYDPTSGVVRVDGVDVRSLDRVELRSRIGYVEQDAPVLAGTIRDNLTLGSPDATDDDCRRVLEAVNLTAVLERGDEGLDAQVGEDGVMLSGGERQRLAIARTLLSAPPILLLDESTSSLDGVNEQRLRGAIDAVAQDRTLIVIAHRLSTVVDSDQIVVVDGGRVVGVGTHSELVVSTPLYRDLAKHQLLV